MDYKEIEHLMKVMNESQLTELEIEKEGFVLKIKKEKEIVPIASRIETPIIERPVEIQNQISTDIKVEKEVSGEKEGIIVYSPIVGTFYSAPAPGAEPFVKVGDKVKKGDVLCIIEAMKIMNEIEAESDGEIVEIFVKNEEMVEYNQPLFRIKA
ncbi:MAG TPA: acetyl-CoA carboxylase biotin carboxyl carrier protein [Defluviitaleaceae bacterium]|jgi:acetyl-CoA carboxylase biotin carboxyl carrier protein|nr:acetyl-CoA carboxylase biotin carboxyl carrier protein [Candidatus Epulonipiscium sp.]HQD49547.1 acetyl-CoA carboxylase biotin carboxyl carrier protein [Defluviitaleaceae bacterium]